jgi:hypothetical protein
MWSAVRRSERDGGLPDRCERGLVAGDEFEGHAGVAAGQRPLGEQAGDQGAHVPFGAIGGAQPVLVVQLPEQGEGCCAFGVANGRRLITVNLRLRAAATNDSTIEFTAALRRSGRNVSSEVAVSPVNVPPLGTG